jgi:hypothetical protein
VVFPGQYRRDLFFLTDQLKRVPHAPVLRVGLFAFLFPEFRWLPPRRNDERQVRAGLGLGDFAGMTAPPRFFVIVHSERQDKL